MIKSILTAIVVAVIVWALSFDFFFEYKGTVFSFAIAVAAGLIAALILRAITSKIGVQIVVVGVVVLLANFVASKFVSRPVCKAVTEATVSCPPNIDPDCIETHKGSDITWVTKNLKPGVTVKIHKFKLKKYLPIPFPAQPLDQKEYTGNNGNNIKAKVNKTGYFKYAITCSEPGQTDKTKDPMIKVPN